MRSHRISRALSVTRQRRTRPTSRITQAHDTAPMTQRLLSNITSDT
jgi:hypothetical protein